MTGHLKLAAADAEDLQILSARLQDATAKVKNISWLPRRHRFAMVVNRFCWEGTANERMLSGLRFDSVLQVRSHNIRLRAPEAVLALLAITFQGHEGQDDEADPGGVVALIFSGGGMIQLTVECIDAELADIAGPWAARARPDHEGPGHGQPETGPETGKEDA